MGPSNGAPVAQDSCSTARASGPGRESSGTAVRLRGNSDSCPNHPEELFDTSGTGTRVPVARDICSIPRDMGQGLTSPGKTG